MNKTTLLKLLAAAGAVATSTSLFADSDGRPVILKAGAIVCESGYTYNESVITDLRNQLAKMEGRQANYTTEGCHTLTRDAGAILESRSGGAATVNLAGETVYVAFDALSFGGQRTETAPASPPAIDPRIASYCSAAMGGSYVLQEVCINEEMQARNNIGRMTVPERIASYCNRAMGGSYVLAEVCIRQEMDARDAIGG